ncbi:MAG: PEP-CTERM sorting domain-containing protein [Myxococcota bacterium]
METDTTWSGEVILAQPIFVKSGATLTIDPGTIVRGQPRTAAVLPGSTAGTPGALIVTQTGTILADGDANNPIIMTTAAVDNNDDGVADDLDGNGFLDAYPGFDPATCPGACTADATPSFLDDTPTTAPLAPLAANGRANVSLWGGLVVLGNATTNLSDIFGFGQGVKTIEGLTVPGFPAADAIYGGAVGVADDTDSSGSLSYISVRHAGDEIGNSNELNGVSLGGVGSGTEFHHIEVYCNFDDGIEWFGGTVNGHHLTVAFEGDDVFDLDEGYRGTNQFLLGVMPFFNALNGATPVTYGASSGDKGCEWDGDDNDEGADWVNFDNNGKTLPFPNANFYNITIAGSAPSATFNGFTNDNDGCEMRNGFAGSLNNAIIYNSGTRQGLDLAGGGAPGNTVTINANDGLIVANAVTCDNVAAVPAGQDEATVFGNGVRNVTCVDGVDDADFKMNARDTSFTPTGVAGKLNASLKTMDFRPSVLNATMADGIHPPAPLEDVTYRGAFDATPAMWTEGWTAFSMAGMLAVPEPGMVQLLGAGAMGLLALARRRR